MSQVVISAEDLGLVKAALSMAITVYQGQIYTMQDYKEKKNLQQDVSDLIGIIAQLSQTEEQAKVRSWRQ